MVNRYYSQDPNRRVLFSSPPLQEFERALNKAQTQYDTNFATLESLKGKYIDALPQDRATANELSKQWDSQIETLVKDAGGDYSTLSKGILELKNNMRKELSPGGKAHAIKSNFDLYQTSLKNNRERLNKGEITQDQLRLLNQKVANEYKGVGQADPLTGAYTQVEIPELAQFVDPSKDLRSLFEKAPKRKVKRIVPQSDGKGSIIYTTQETEDVDPNQLKTSGVGQLTSDPKYLNYLSQMADLQGLTGAQKLAYMQTKIDDEVSSLVPQYSGNFSNTQEQEIKLDQAYKLRADQQHDFAMEKLKQRNRIALEDHKDALKKMQEESPSGDNLSLLTLGQNATGQYQPVDPLKQEVDIPYTAPVGYLGQGGTSPELTAKGTRKSKVSIPEILSSPDKYKSVNTNLLRSIERANPSLPAATKWDIYNKSLSKDNYGLGVYYDQYDTPEAMKRDADVNFAKLGTGQVSVQFIDANTGKVQDVSASKQRELYQQYYDSKNRKANVAVLGKASTQTGQVIAGSVFSIPAENGYYVLGENNERANAYNQTTRKAAFGFIADDKEFGDPFEVYDASTRTRQQLVGVKTYEPTEAGYMQPKVRYAPYLGKNSDGTPKLARKSGGSHPSAKGEIDYLQSMNSFGEVQDLTPAHIEKLVRPELHLPVNKRSGDKETNTLIED